MNKGDQNRPPLPSNGEMKRYEQTPHYLYTTTKTVIAIGASEMCKITHSEIADVTRQFKNRYNLTNKQMANFFHVSERTIYLWLSGKGAGNLSSHAIMIANMQNDFTRLKIEYGDILS